MISDGKSIFMIGVPNAGFSSTEHSFDVYKYTDIFLKLVFDVVGVGMGYSTKNILEDSTKKEQIIKIFNFPMH
jgi:hypothetical protein